jgi:hypothetical protein
MNQAWIVIEPGADRLAAVRSMARRCRAADCPMVLRAATVMELRRRAGGWAATWGHLHDVAEETGQPIVAELGGRYTGAVTLVAPRAWTEARAVGYVAELTGNLGAAAGGAFDRIVIQRR